MEAGDAGGEEFFYHIKVMLETYFFNSFGVVLGGVEFLFEIMRQAYSHLLDEEIDLFVSLDRHYAGNYWHFYA